MLSSTEAPSELPEILWIEDDPLVSGWGGPFLAREGFGVQLAPTGSLGLALAGSREYDLIILEWRLPDMGGHDLLRALRAADVKVPVMVCTGYFDDGEEGVARSSGADDFYPKPLRGAAWLARIRGLVGPSREELVLERYLRWHVCLLAGALEVREEVAAEFLPVLSRRLGRRWPRADSGTIGTAVTSALMDYFQRPTSYDPAQLPLDGFLALISRRRFANLQRGIARRLLHEEAAGDLLPDHAGDLEIAVSRFRDLRVVMKVCRTRADRAFMHARLRGEKRTQILWAILDLAPMLPAAQQVEVHRAKDRLRLRILRARRVRDLAE